MADEFQTGACSGGGGWWNVEAAETKTVAAVSCEVSAASVSGSSLSFQDLHRAPAAGIATGFLLDSSAAGFGFGLASPSVECWTHDFQGGGEGRGGGSFQYAMLQEDQMSSGKPYGLMQTNQIHPGAVEIDSTTGLLRDVSHAFLVDQQHLGSGNIVDAAAAASTAAFFQGLLEPVDLPRNPQHGAQIDNVDYRATANELPPPPMQWSNLHQQQQQPAGQFRFSNSAPQFWNAPTAGDARGGFYDASMNPPQYVAQPTTGKCSPNTTKMTTAVKGEGAARDNASINPTMKKSSSEPSFKKPRMEMPSPVPAFKVRKEKLGDRITALQQLVSPFGKTDTASVLYEAIEYIKFLHDQVNVLTTPYLKNGHPMQHHQNFDKAKEGEGVKKDLRSRGLCLVPISSTFAVANEPADFWTPTFGGTFR